MRGKNLVMLMGNLAADPEQKNIGGKTPLVLFRIGVTESFRRDGQQVDVTEWINIKCWGEGLCNFIMANMKKGDAVSVDGKFKTEMWENNGEKRYASFVVVNGFDGSRVDLIGKKPVQGASQGSRDGRAPQQQDGQRQQPTPRQQSQPAPSDPFDDEIPF